MKLVQEYCDELENRQVEGVEQFHHSELNAIKNFTAIARRDTLKANHQQISSTVSDLELKIQELKEEAKSKDVPLESPEEQSDRRPEQTSLPERALNFFG